MKAVSLLEMVLALSIVALVTVLGLSHWSTIRRQNQARRMGEDLYYLLLAAKRESYNAGKSLVVCPMMASKKHCGKDWSRGVWLVRLSPVGKIEHVYQQLKLPLGMTLRWHSFPVQNFIVFSAKPGLVMLNGHFELKAPRSPFFQIKINRLGLIEREWGR